MNITGVISHVLIAQYCQRLHDIPAPNVNKREAKSDNKVAYLTNYPSKLESSTGRANTTLTVVGLPSQNIGFSSLPRCDANTRLYSGAVISLYSHPLVTHIWNDLHTSVHPLSAIGNYHSLLYFITSVWNESLFLPVSLGAIFGRCYQDKSILSLDILAALSVIIQWLQIAMETISKYRANELMYWVGAEPLGVRSVWHFGVFDASYVTPQLGQRLVPFGLFLLMSCSSFVFIF